MLTNTACAARVITWANRMVDDTAKEVMMAACDVTGYRGAEKEWDDRHPNDGVGGWSTNPYALALKRAQERKEQGETRYNDARAIRDFIVKQVCATFAIETSSLPRPDAL